MIHKNTCAHEARYIQQPKSTGCGGLWLAKVIDSRQFSSTYGAFAEQQRHNLYNIPRKVPIIVWRPVRAIRIMESDLVVGGSRTHKHPTVCQQQLFVLVILQRFIRSIYLVNLFVAGSKPRETKPTTQ